MAWRGTPPNGRGLQRRGTLHSSYIPFSFTADFAAERRVAPVELTARARQDTQKLSSSTFVFLSFSRSLPLGGKEASELLAHFRDSTLWAPRKLSTPKTFLSSIKTRPAGVLLGVWSVGAVVFCVCYCVCVCVCGFLLCASWPFDQKLVGYSPQSKLHFETKWKPCRVVWPSCRCWSHWHLLSARSWTNNRPSSTSFKTIPISQR